MVASVLDLLVASTELSTSELNDGNEPTKFSTSSSPIANMAPVPVTAVVVVLLLLKEYSFSDLSIALMSGRRHEDGVRSGSSLAAGVDRTESSE